MDKQKEFLKLCIDGNLEELKKINIDDIDINFDNNRALISSIYNGHVSVLKYLIEHGANISAITDESIRWAKMQEYFDVIKYIEEARENNFSKIILDLIKEDGAQENDLEKAKKYLECECIEDVLDFLAKKNHLNAIKYILENDSNIELYNTCMFAEAARKGNLEIIKYLCEFTSYAIEAMENALIFSVQYGHLSIVKYLVEANKGLDITINGNEPINLAARNGHLHIVKYLTENGVDVNKEDHDALEEAAENGHIKIVRYLIEEKHMDIKDKHKDIIAWAANGGQIEIIKYLESMGADPHIDEDIALIWAAGSGHLDAVKYLEKKGASLTSKNNEAFILATCEWQFDVMEYLATKEGVNINLNDNEAVRIAGSGKRYSLVKLLYEKGASLQAIEESLQYDRTMFTNALEFLETKLSK